MKTFTLKVLKPFHDSVHNVKREKKSTFEETDEVRAKKLLDLGYVTLLGAKPTDTPHLDNAAEGLKTIAEVGLTAEEAVEGMVAMANTVANAEKKPKKKRRKRKDLGTQSTSSQPEQESKE